MPGLTSKDHAALQRFAREVRREFANQTVRLRLFGSKARGDAAKFSDVDVLVILESATWRDQQLISRLTSRILVDTGVFLAAKVFSRRDIDHMRSNRSLFWRSIEPDLIPL